MKAINIEGASISAQIARIKSFESVRLLFWSEVGVGIEPIRCVGPTVGEARGLIGLKTIGAGIKAIWSIGIGAGIKSGLQYHRRLRLQS